MKARAKAWQLLRETFVEWWDDDTFRLAAALAFYTIFSLAPVLLIAVGVASFFLARETATDRIITEMRQLIGQNGANAVRQVIDASRGLGKGIGAVAVGGFTFLLGATAVFAELQAALNKVWGVEAVPKRGVIIKFLLDRLRSFGIALAVGFLLLVSLVVSAALSAIQDYLNDWMPGMPALWQVLNTGASFVLVTLLFAMIYKYLPDVKITWRHVWVGAAVTAALFTIGKYLISLYLGQTAMASAFGAAGSFAVLLIWIYYSSLICFFGAEFTQVYARQFGQGIKPEDHARSTGKKKAIAG